MKPDIKPEIADWYFFGPYPVVMATTVGADGEYRVSPFTWVTPIGKNGTFCIAMRRRSETLKNLRIVGRLAASWLPDDPDIAQKVLETRKTEEPYKFPLLEVEGIKFPVPEPTIACIDARVFDFSMPLWGLDGKCQPTHQLVMFEALNSVVLDPEKSPMLFTRFRTFWSAKPYEVEGYELGRRS